MTQIFKLSGEMTWSDSIGEKDIVTATEAAKVVALPSLDEDTLVSEMDLIERTASSGKNYYYSSKWSPEMVCSLKEFACACEYKGKMIEVDPENEDIKGLAVVASEHATLEKQASANEPKPKDDSLVSQLSEALGDPFKLSDVGDVTQITGENLHKTKEQKAAAKAEAKKEWEKVTPSSKLGDASSITLTNSIVPLAGEYEYDKSPNLRVKPGQNSVARPDAIGDLIKSEDTGERLHKENAQRSKERKAEKKMWEKDEVKRAKDLGAGAFPRGSVFMTESMNAQPGIRDGLVQAGVYQEAKAELPDRTAGEKLAEQNKSRKAGIQRQKEGARAWEKVVGASRHEISDVFAEAIEKSLGQKA